MPSLFSKPSGHTHRASVQSNPVSVPTEGTRSLPTKPFQPRALAARASISNIPSGAWAMTPFGMPLSRIKAVSARVSTPDRPMMLRCVSQSPSSDSERQFEAGVIGALKIAPRAALWALSVEASSSSTVVPVFPIWGKVKQMI